jgi:hypothetical protein
VRIGEDEWSGVVPPSDVTVRPLGVRDPSIEPFGVTRPEAKALVNMGGVARRQAALGRSVRRFTDTQGETTKRPTEVLPRVVPDEPVGFQPKRWRSGPPERVR